MLYMALDIMPQNLKEKWWLYTDDKDNDWPNPIIFLKNLPRKAFLQDGFQFSKGSERNKTEKAQIETSTYQRHHITVPVQIWEKQNKRKTMSVRFFMVKRFLMKVKGNSN